MTLQAVLGFASIGLLAAVGVLWTRERRLQRSLDGIRRLGEQIASGDFSARLPASHPAAAALNRLAESAARRLERLERQLEAQRAIHDSMVEGVVTLDEDARIRQLNPAAARLFGAPAERASGRPIQEIVRNADLHQLIADVLAGGRPAEGHITMFNGAERNLQAHVTRLRDPEGRGLGALLVLNDLTTVRRLESLQRDFVANVSHELKTPITSIKGFIETLQDGALNHEADARRFLDIMARQADRLQAIIEDLLNLSRIEEEADQKDLPLEKGPLRPCLEAALQTCRLKAEERKVRLELEADAGIRAPINAALLEQAAVNLLDNAIKFSPPDSPVTLRLFRDESRITVQVRDQGCGIAAEHLPRLFERFYRVDKARSRQLGGTGLGLAIVKYIAQIHGGWVEVESQPGRGSVFSLRLPG